MGRNCSLYGAFAFFCPLFHTASQLRGHWLVIPRDDVAQRQRQLLEYSTVVVHGPGSVMVV